MQDLLLVKQLNVQRGSFDQALLYGANSNHRGLKATRSVRLTNHATSPITTSLLLQLHGLLRGEGSWEEIVRQRLGSTVRQRFGGENLDLDVVESCRGSNLDHDVARRRCPTENRDS